MNERSEIVRVRDVDFFVVRVGSGRPILVCGGSQLGHSYMRALDDFADSHELIYFDARGSGRTERGDSEERTFTEAIADLEGLSVGLGLDRFTILGHSLGGHLAYLYTATHPEAIESLVLVDVGPPLARSQAAELSREMRARRTPDDAARLEQIPESPAFQQGDPKAVEELILTIYAPFFRDRRTLETIDLGFTKITAQNVLDYEDQMVESLTSEDPPARLAQISCPTLVVHGELDPVPAAFGQELAGSIANAQFVLLPGASHFPFIEDRAQFEATVRPFLRALAN